MAGLTSIAKNRGDGCVADFYSYKLLKTSEDSSPTHTGLQRTRCLLTLPSKIKIPQPGRSTASQPGKIFIPNMNFPRSPTVPCLVIYTAKPSALVWAQRVSEDSSCHLRRLGLHDVYFPDLFTVLINVESKKK